MSTKLKEWTADELVAELKRRERGEAAKAAGGARNVAASTRGARVQELAAIPTAELAQAAQNRQRVIYGVDNRKDLFQVSSSRVKKSAAAVVALVKSSDLTRQPDGSFALATSSYQADYQLCGSEPFVNAATWVLLLRISRCTGCRRDSRALRQERTGLGRHPFRIRLPNEQRADGTHDLPRNRRLRRGHAHWSPAGRRRHGLGAGAA